MKVAICITTFRRPDGLKRLLEGLDTQVFTRGPVPDVTVVVIDNDAERPLQDSHPTFKLWSQLAIDYRVEAKRGLAHARNAALAAVDASYDVLAFIDDDEWPEPQWLDALLAMHQASGAMVIQGPVKPAFSSPPKPWMQAIGLYEVGPFEDGAALDWGASGNCLIDKKKLDACGLVFDTSFNHSGGEDSDLFARLLRRGERIVAARDAVAYETVPPERMQVAWAMRRSYRLGHTLGRLSLSRAGLAAPGMRAVKALGRLGQGVCQLVAGIASPTMAVKGLANVAWAAGTLAAFARMEVTHYKPPAKI